SVSTVYRSIELGDLNSGYAAWRRSLITMLGYRRLTIRYERHGHLFNAFLVLAAAITCYKKLAKQST
ncbi:hypothetical protein ABT299_51625, partial [Spirillospora sp. NPDC000708]